MHDWAEYELVRLDASSFVGTFSAYLAMYVWSCLGTNQTIKDVSYGQDAVSAMYITGNAPWTHAGEGALLHFGRIFHRVNSDLDRCNEELLSLVVEKKRMIAWLRYNLGLIDCALSGHAEVQRPTTYVGIVDAHVQGLFGAGKAYLLTKLKMQYEGMLTKLHGFTW